MKEFIESETDLIYTLDERKGLVHISARGPALLNRLSDRQKQYIRNRFGGPMSFEDDGRSIIGMTYRERKIRKNSNFFSEAEARL